MRLLFSLLLVASASASAQTGTAVDAFGVDVLAPVDLVVAPGQPDRVYIVEQGILAPDYAPRVRTLVPGDASATTFVDLGPRVRVGGEAGLLGLAFHPDYATNGRLFVSYTAGSPLRSVVAELARSAADPLQADLATERVLLEVEQPEGNHNAGQIQFGPDGFLYIALGDGGGAGDPGNHGQRPSTYLGSILRIDVDAREEGAAYGIPESNPFAQTDGLEQREVYAYGFRNPWKFAFDGATGDLWAMDVGQDAWEEINRVERGGNYGWNAVEGPACFLAGCDVEAYEAPVFSYPHDNATGGYSVSGGMVYRGSDLPALAGRVLYADYVTRRVWALDADRAEPDHELLLTTSRGTNNAGISAIREGPGGEAYILVYSFNGPTRILRLESVAVASAPGPGPAPALQLVGPNPFAPSTAVDVALADGGPARVTLHDALGRELAVLFDGALAPSATRRVEVSGETLPPGVYVVRLVAGDRTAVRQLVRVR